MITILATMTEKVFWSWSAAIASADDVMVDDEGSTWGVILRQKVDSKGQGADLFAVEVCGVEDDGSTPCFGAEKYDIQGIKNAVATFNGFVERLGGKPISADQFKMNNKNCWDFCE